MRAGLVLLLCCLVAEAAHSSKAEKKHPHKHAAGRRDRHIAKHNERADLLTATAGMCHFLETEAFTGMCVGSKCDRARACTRVWALPEVQNTLGRHPVHLPVKR